MKLYKGLICCTILLIPFVLIGGCSTRQISEDIVVENRPVNTMSEYTFPLGYEEFHVDPAINFLFNRTYSMGYARYEDMAAAGSRIVSRDDLIPEMVRSAEAAAADGRLMNAAFYYRIAEFYIPWSDPDKKLMYDRFIENFYLAVSGDDYQLMDIPLGKAVVPVMYMASREGNKKGTIILHSGYDGYKEELYSIMFFLSKCGYEVINFDVPWMGGDHSIYTEMQIYEWEKLVGAVLDYYELDDVTIFGLSMGGWLSLRAAALDPRISRVIASSVSFDVNQYVGAGAQLITRFFRIALPKATNKMILKKMESDPQQAWFFDHLMHVTDKTNPIDAANVLAEINEKNLHSDLITQDVLILTGKEDHFVPFKMHGLQVKALTNAASVTPMVFTRDVHGHNHCQVGNLGLALDIIIEWMENVR